MKHLWIVLLLIYPINSYADSINLSVGHNKAGFRDRCNLRQTQSPFEDQQSTDMHSDAWEVSYTGDTGAKVLGLDINYTVGFRNLGETRAEGKNFVSDEDCQAFRWDRPFFGAKWVSRTYGYVFTLDPAYRFGDWSIFGQIGLFHFVDKVIVNDGQFHDSENGNTPMLGLGAIYKNLVLSYSYIKRPYTTNSPGADAHTLLLGYRLPL